MARSSVEKQWAAPCFLEVLHSAFVGSVGSAARDSAHPSLGGANHGFWGCEAVPAALRWRGSIWAVTDDQRIRVAEHRS